MAISSLAAAKKICELRNWNASNLEINKILYIAHMLLLGRSQGGHGLVNENFQAWDYGPVLPSVYQKAKVFGNNSVQNVFHEYSTPTVGAEADILAETVNSLSQKSAAELVAITHWERGAWASHYTPGAKGIIIPNGEILREYRTRTAVAANAA